MTEEIVEEEQLIVTDLDDDAVDDLETATKFREAVLGYLDQLSNELEPDERGYIYTSSRGIKVRFLPVPLTLRQTIETNMVQGDWPKPEVPTYEVETFGEDVEHHPYDPKYVEQQDDEEVTKTWLDYQQAVRDWNTEFQEKIDLNCKLRCMEFLEELDTSQDWAQAQKYAGIKLPKNKLELKLHYIETEFIGSQKDQISIVQIPMALNVIKGGMLDTVERMFPEDSVEEGGNH